MKIDGTHYRSLWWNHEQSVLEIIDQRWLPHSLRTQAVPTLQDFADAIAQMRVRGAPLIGATAAYGMALAMSEDPSNEHMDTASDFLFKTRPTAVNLRWALDRCRKALRDLPEEQRAESALQLAHEIAEEDVEINRRIGEHGLALIRDVVQRKNPGDSVQLLTHCNAGWLATVDWGTATSPMFQAHDEGIDLHVWVDETRPRNQGALTAWELGSHGVPHTYITDNAGGHLMQHGEVDLVIVGTDRTTRRGDVCNKIGTYLKALAARDNNVPFYVALPSPTIDWTVEDGLKDIPIEQRSPDEVTRIQGKSSQGIESVLVAPEGSPGGNPAFDVTPNHLVSGLITERGISDASAESLAALFPELAQTEQS
ncbi:MAG: S-methyl-5-thioribose-1-phosphate isomerase [Granulosicoccus sp.]|nr:S-methyl-5-thioribose-1-phosphate isomerase [Granulosicoccus sp.]